jgi:hypothetical protein
MGERGGVTHIANDPLIKGGRFLGGGKVDCCINHSLHADDLFFFG